jgi:hypothetical protein
VVAENIPKSKYTDNSGPPKKKNENMYKAFSEIETSGEQYLVVNFYNEKEFRLLLNNQIAYYKSTEKVFTLCSILLNKAVENKGLLTLNQLKNAVRLSVDKKDKITVMNDRIIVLIVGEDQKTVNKLIARIKSNLPVENNEQLSKVIQYISVYTLQVDEHITSADEMLGKIFSDKMQDQVT